MSDRAHQTSLDGSNIAETEIDKPERSDEPTKSSVKEAFGVVGTPREVLIEEYDTLGAIEDASRVELVNLEGVGQKTVDKIELADPLYERGTDGYLVTDGGVDTGGSDVEDFYPTECVLCDHSADTFEEHEQHMEEVHDENDEDLSQYHWSETELPWRERILRLQTDQPPKSVQDRGTYYYNDGFGERRQIYLTHEPEMSPGLRVSKILRPGVFDESYTNLSAGESFDLRERDALKLLHALQAYFRDHRAVPYWMDIDADQERDPDE